MCSDREAADVLEYKIRCLQLQYEANKMMYQRIPRVVERPIANYAESMARRAPENYIHGLFADAGVLSDIAGVDFGHASANGSTRGKIELVGRTMDRVVFD